MLIQCPACGSSLEAAQADGAVAADVLCPSCGQRLVARDAAVAPPGSGDHTVPFRAVPRRPPAGRSGDQTAIPGQGPALALPRDGRVSVVVLSGPRKGDVLVFAKPRIVIGREGGDADLQVPDPEVSRAHAALECYGARVVLRDLGSRNGTFVGKARVPARDVEDQAEFRLGSTQFLLVVTERG
jgi:hypothetical protein